MRNYLRGKDALGATPNMTYKSEESFGTSLGGCCSCFVTIFVAFYVLLSFWSFFF